MWQNWRFAFARLFVLVLLFAIVPQPHVMAAQTTNMAQLQQATSSQQHQQQPQQHHQQQTSTSQQHVHHAPAPINTKSNRQSVSTHPGSSSGSSSGGHNLGLSSAMPQSLNAATLLSNTVGPASVTSSSSSTSQSASSSVGTVHLPVGQYVVNDKDAAVQEVLKHFSAAAAAAAAASVDDDLGESYQIINDLKREVNPILIAPAQGPQNLPTPPPPAPPPSSSVPLSNGGSAPNYPWNMFERPSFYNAMSLPPISPMAALFPHLFNPFDSYHPSPFPVTPRFMPFMSYAQPILVPYPFYMAPEMFYPGFSAPSVPIANEYEDAMSRGAGSSRRPASPSSSNSHTSSSGYPRNSPIYYVRLPPTPYMFLPGLGLGTATASAGYPTMLPYQSLPSFPPFSPVFNVPINFLANGKPGNVYQIGGSPNDLQFPNVPPNYPSRVSSGLPSPPPPPPTHPFNNGGYKPTTSTHNYFNAPPSSGPSHNYASFSPSSPPAAPPSMQHQQDSKLTSLKRPYFFNGRPEDIYILPNNFNPMYSNENSYY